LRKRRCEPDTALSLPKALVAVAVETFAGGAWHRKRELPGLSTGLPDGGRGSGRREGGAGNP